jgi:hypothetical protein
MIFTVSPVRRRVRKPGGPLCSALVVPLTVAMLAACSRGSPPTEITPLPRLAIEAGTITVSGVSSGGYLAHHLHVAASATVSGAAVIAAGPYACAGFNYPWNLLRTLARCMNLPDLIPFLGPPDPADSLDRARREEERGRIDPLRHLADDRVLFFSGTLDTFVPRPVVESAKAFYGELVAPGHLRAIWDVPAPHAMVADGAAGSCTDLASPFINDCGFDLAGAVLAHLYGPLDPPQSPTGALLAFDQRLFTDPGTVHGLGGWGYLYVPPACAAGEPCRLHVALHGCLQHGSAVGDAFARHAGYNRWADANRIAVLYPQAAAGWQNPAGCWDWWGFTGPGYATKNGPQIAAIRAMIDRLAGRPGGSADASR